VVVSDIGGLTEVVVNEQTGIVVPPKDAEKLAQAILRLGEDPVLRKQMGERARRQVIEKFSLSESVRLMERMYRKVSARPHVDHHSDHRTEYR
jgi:glycosyltransferase involved in cell wall biosynthesis